MTQLRIPLHSMTDLITNSSTVIYTYSDSSKDAMIDMVNEFLLVLGVDKKCKDMFVVEVELENDDTYRTYIDDELWDSDIETLEGLDCTLEEWSNFKWEKQEEKINELLLNIRSGKVDKPQWMKDAECQENGNGYRPSTTLVITPKSDEYNKLADLIHKFLYSTENESCSDG
jgi:hypothetical protein